MSSLFDLPHWITNLLIWSVWSVVPLSWLYLVYRLVAFLLVWSQHLPLDHHPSSRVSIIWLSLSTIEVLFSIVYLCSAWVIQRKVCRFDQSTTFIRTTILRIVATGVDSSFEFPSNQQATSDLPSKVAQRPSSSRPSSPSSFALFHSLAFEDPRAIEFRSHLALWFRNCKWEEIRRENLMEWLSWSLFGLRLEDLRKADAQASSSSTELRSKLLEESLNLFENRSGSKLKPGYNPDLSNRVIRLTLDPIKFQLRPFGLYFVFNLANVAVKRMLKRAGFRQAQCNHPSGYGLRYFVRKPPGWSQLLAKDRSVPLIFIHGLGIGLFQYVNFLKYLAHSPWARKRPVVILIQPSISQEIFSEQHLRPPTRESLTADICQLIYTEDFAQVGIELVGHSMGTIVAAWVIKALSKKEIIRRICLIDPVCFCLWEAHVCYNFLYSHPRTSIEKLIRYFVGTELGIGYHIHRYFSWSSNILWPFEVPGFTNSKRFQVFLSENDSILNAPRVRNYLIENGMDDGKGVFMVKGAAHGASIIEKGYHFELIQKWLEN